MRQAGLIPIAAKVKGRVWEEQMIMPFELVCGK
jgi:hypothetical protein